jgi:hypothetical protein
MSLRNEDLTDDEVRKLITDACESYEIEIQDFAFDEDNQRAKALLGRWVAIDDAIDGMWQAGEEGELDATVVGAPRYDNVRVDFYFKPDGCEMGMPAQPFETVEPL